LRFQICKITTFKLTENFLNIIYKALSKRVKIRGKSNYLQRFELIREVKPNFVHNLYTTKMREGMRERERRGLTHFTIMRVCEDLSKHRLEKRHSNVYK